MIGALLLWACAHTIPARPAHLPEDAQVLLDTVDLIAKRRSNQGRQRAAAAVARAQGLDPAMERIDLWSLQRNLVVELPGETDQIAYLVAHTDKTDASWPKLVSLMVNGLFDDIIGWTFLSEGAVDNATGVAVVTQVAARLAALPTRRYTWRVLLAGSEESGLRGTRAHLARIGADERDRIALALNVDSVGLRYTQNCLLRPGTSPELAELALSARGELPLGLSTVPPGATSDHAVFAMGGPGVDVGRGILFNLPGGLLPQRSWFTTPHSAPTLFMSGCDLLDAGDLLASLTLLPTGHLHGPRDHRGQVDPERLWEASELLWRTVLAVEGVGRRH